MEGPQCEESHVLKSEQRDTQKCERAVWRLVDSWAVMLLLVTELYLEYMVVDGRGWQTQSKESQPDL